MSNTAQALPLDIKREWLNLVRRVQSVARQPTGSQAVITIRVLVDADGNPLHWTEPQVVKIEPRAANLLDALSGGDGP